MTVWLGELTLSPGMTRLHCIASCQLYPLSVYLDLILHSSDVKNMSFWQIVNLLKLIHFTHLHKQENRIEKQKYVAFYYVYYWDTGNAMQNMTTKAEEMKRNLKKLV